MAVDAAELPAHHPLGRAVAARPLAQGRIPQPWRAPLLLQAASAAAFFASRGFSLSSADLETAAWDVAASRCACAAARCASMTGTCRATSHTREALVARCATA